MPSAAVRLMQTAEAGGVEICFANPGTTEMPLVAALDEVVGIRAVLGLFEGVCTGCADGWGRMRRRPALTLLHLGPGFANGVANLHNARRARSPVLNLVGDHTRNHLGFDAPLTSDIESLARTVSAWVDTATSPTRLTSDFSEALAACLTPPGQVATLIVPADVQWEEGASPAELPQRPSRTRVPAERIRTIAERLRSSHASGLLLGGRALGETGQRAADRIARATGAKLFAETFPARWERGGDLPQIERLAYFPEQARATFAGLEVLVVADAPDPVAFFGYRDQESELAPRGAIARLSGPEEDAEDALEALADELGAPTRAPATPAPPPANPQENTLNPTSLAHVLASRLPEDAIVVDEAATSGLPFYGAPAPRHTLLSLTGGAIGQGLPCAAGAALACPERPVIAFQADGSAQYTVQALFTLARENLNVVVVLCANRAYRILQIELARAGITEPGPRALSLTSLEDPEIDWVALARGYGVPADRVADLPAFDRVLHRALAEPGPYLVEAIL